MYAFSLFCMIRWAFTLLQVIVLILSIRIRGLFTYSCKQWSHKICLQCHRKVWLKLSEKYFKFWNWLISWSICLQRLFKKYDKDEDDQIDFSEFVHYVQDHEKELRLYFKKIDTNDDGMCMRCWMVGNENMCLWFTSGCSSFLTHMKKSVSLYQYIC